MDTDSFGLSPLSSSEINPTSSNTDGGESDGDEETEAAAAQMNWKQKEAFKKQGGKMIG